MWPTSEYGGDECGEEAASVNAQIKHREECTSLPSLQKQERYADCSVHTISNTNIVMMHTENGDRAASITISYDIVQ